MRRLPSSALRLVRQALAAGGKMLWDAASGPGAPRPVSKAAGRVEAPASEAAGERTGERTLRIRIRASEVRFRGTTNM
jgi:hypothetical protein